MKILLLLLLPFITFAQTSGLLYDDSTKKIVWSYNQNDILPIASLTKMMTALLIIEDIKCNNIVCDNRIKNLLKLTLINSDNNASVELSKTSKYFIKRMNDRAKSLHMINTIFYNPSGLPDISDNKSTVLDLLILSKELLKHKEILEITKTYQCNHNKLVCHKNIDGLKTGFTKNAGFCIVVTSNLNRRLIYIVLGCKSQNGRNDMAFKKMNWYYKSIGLEEMK